MNEHDGYIRVIEQFPQLLQLQPWKDEDFKLIISMCYQVGLADGYRQAMEFIMATLITGVKEKEK